MELLQCNYLTTSSNSVLSDSTRGCCKTGMRVSLPASASLTFMTDSIRNKKRNNHIAKLLSSFYHSPALQLLLFQMHLFACADKPQTVRSFAHGNGPSQEFFLGVNVTEIQRTNSWLHSCPFCSSLVLQRGCKADSGSQLNLFSGKERNIIKTRLFPLEKWASFCSRNERAVMKFYNLHNKPIIEIVTKCEKALNFQ